MILLLCCVLIHDRKNKTILFEKSLFLIHPFLFFVVYTRNKEFMEVGDRIDEWVNQCVRGVLSEKDRIELLRWLEATPEHEKQFREMLRIGMRVSAVGQWSELDDIQQRTWDKITPFIERRRKKLYMWGTRIASVIIVMVGVALIWQNESDQEIGTMQVSNVLQVESGSPKAILVTSAGEKIALNDDKTYQVADISGVEIIQDSTGSVRFEDRGVTMEEEICRYSSIVVPEKGEYQAILSDGTKVWINSDSKLEFPDRFRENIREVKLTGEAYFEVVADTKRPFYVQVGEAKVQVLGTAFNVSAYREDQQVEVALLRGKVGLDLPGNEYVLAPGEIATWNKGDRQATLRKGDVESIVDWKTGRFNFEDMSLDKLTVKLARWYGVQFIFEDETTKEFRFSGAVTKYRTLDYVLGMIAKTTKVAFQEKDGKILVRKIE